MGTANGLIAQARNLIGTGENPPGSNHNFITVWYSSTVANIGDGAWCDMSVTYEAWHSDNKAAIGGGFAYVPAHAEWFRSHGQWTYGMHGIRAGDIVFYEWNGRRTTQADHVGVVERVLSDGTIYSLEGNISDAFRREHRDSTYIAGYGRPLYSGATPPPQEDDMPQYTSIAILTPQAGTGLRTLQWDHTYEDDAHFRDPAQTSPGLATGAAHGTIFTVTVKLSGDGRARLVEVDPKNGYKASKDDYSWHPITGEAWAENGVINPGQHLWVQADSPGPVSGTAKISAWPRS